MFAKIRFRLVSMKMATRDSTAVASLQVEKNNTIQKTKTVLWMARTRIVMLSCIIIFICDILEWTENGKQFTCGRLDQKKK